MAELIQVTTTASSREEAEHIGRTLVAERLAACAQVSGPLTSIYHWQGRVETAAEWYCVLKTTRERYRDLEPRLKSLHSYQTPEIVAAPLAPTDPAYADWVVRSVLEQQGTTPPPPEQR
jgi:periplasmic divalent cation tolerance protein